MSSRRQVFFYVSKQAAHKDNLFPRDSRMSALRGKADIPDPLDEVS